MIDPPEFHVPLVVDGFIIWSVLQALLDYDQSLDQSRIDPSHAISYSPTKHGQPQQLPVLPNNLRSVRDA